MRGVSLRRRRVGEVLRYLVPSGPTRWNRTASVSLLLPVQRHWPVKIGRISRSSHYAGDGITADEARYARQSASAAIGRDGYQYHAICSTIATTLAPASPPLSGERHGERDAATPIIDHSGGRSEA